ncbi:HEPN domain-containing protein [Pseudalkalibacillus caeni]|uniref:Uncharacterized protein n=1 Tax=Exobacillus caeni TaxID=2574798 RepID=A0A5R9F430_9BACL|nr:HEPN domain-containing protein [Pseudalkalibacillus caeni]TLS37259.1 hypothetical protein FCL54_12100 [Pseudalkalibacillus caeni]
MLIKSYVEIPLPFRLPIEEGNKAVTGYQNKIFQVEFKHSPLYLSKDKIEYTETIQTLLKITYIYDGDGVPSESSEMLRGIIYNCLGFINNFLSALRFTNELNYIQEISVYDLPDFLPIEVDGETYLYITSPMQLIEEREILNGNDLSKTQQMLSTWEKHPEIGLVDRFYSSAKHSLASENFLSAIIELQTSFEIFIRNTMRLIIVQDGIRFNKPKKEIEKEILNKKNLPFRNLVEQHLSRKLGVKLNFHNHDVVNEWYEKLYKIRNDIVHSGKFFVTDNEAKEAYDSYVKIRNYISTKLIEKNYLSEDGNVNLKYFEEVYSNPLKDNEIHEKLKKFGFLPD